MGAWLSGAGITVGKMNGVAGRGRKSGQARVTDDAKAKHQATVSNCVFFTKVFTTPKYSRCSSG